ncbi:MAG: hypothetical protein K8R34_06530 [Methanosarcinales archaeon]|nr:hypothetical protein [Methanosarcinales archaeon]
MLGMPVRIHFSGTTYSQNKAAIKASFPKTSKWDMKSRKGWFGKDLDITAHLRSGEPGTLYLEGKQDYIDSVATACKEIVESCQVGMVDKIPDFQPFEPERKTQAKYAGIDLSPEAMMKSRIQNEQVIMEACGMPGDFIRKWIAIIEKEYQDLEDKKN